MTVIATLLAGLASSEMTRAQYNRAFGAQLQSKAGDQWSYFQAKKQRGAMQRNTLELLQAIADLHPVEIPALKQVPDVAAPRATRICRPLLQPLKRKSRNGNQRSLEACWRPGARRRAAIRP